MAAASVGRLLGWAARVRRAARAALPERKPKRLPVVLDPRVPTVERWDPRGLVGVIGTGPHAGERIFAEREVDRRGGYRSYILELPAECLRDEDGRVIAHFGNWDFHVPGAEPGILDHLTQALDVRWSTSPADVDAYLAQEDE